jgi:hypothetical protein
MTPTLNLVLMLVGRELDDIEADLAACEHQWFIDKSLGALRDIKNQLTHPQMIDCTQHLVTRIGGLLEKYQYKVVAPTPLAD